MMHIKNVYDLFDFRFRITDLHGAGFFRVSLKFMICSEDRLPCEQEIIVLNNSLLPKPSCDWNLGTPIKGMMTIRRRANDVWIMKVSGKVTETARENKCHCRTEIKKVGT